jgi:lysophospholipase L1-like esterase
MPLGQHIITDIYKTIFDIKSYDNIGDILNITEPNTQTYPSYSFNSNIIEENLQQQFEIIFKDRKNLPHIIWLTAPLLVDPTSSSPISTIRHECNYCAQLMAWFPPPQYNDRSLFVDDQIHLNIRGRAVWSREVAQELKAIFVR